jgi:hypothetical protein
MDAKRKTIYQSIECFDNTTNGDVPSTRFHNRSDPSRDVDSASFPDGCTAI